jgi:two-component system, OmpR family, phosphate regulon sensor histidine kinase PhoR
MENKSLRTFLILSILTQLAVGSVLAFVTLNEVMIAFLLLGSVTLMMVVFVLLQDQDTKMMNRYEDHLRHVSEHIIANEEYPTNLPDDVYFSELKRLGKHIELINQKYASRKGQLEAILNSLRNGLVAIDASGKIIFANPRFNEMYHLRKDLKEVHLSANVYDKNILDVIDQLDKEPFVEKKFVEQTNGLIYTYRGILILSQGKKIGKIISIENVTKVANLDSMKQTFVSNVTHELKTPLTSIRGFAETLQSMEPSDEKYKEFLSIIEREAERLNNLITDILLLSELEATGQPKKADFIEVTPLIEDVAMIVQHQLRAEVKLQVTVDEDLKVYFDPFQFRQIVLNLTTNAIKYTDSGTVEIRMMEEDQRVVLQVSDTGIGIPETEQGRVFERFYRVDKDRSRATGGTGLGLSIVKHIVENNRCQMFLDSEVGQGTTVTIVFPAAPKRK